MLERKFQGSNLAYRREHRLADVGDIVDFLVDDKIILEVKAKRLILKEDFYQLQRYLNHFDKKLGLIVNFCLGISKLFPSVDSPACFHGFPQPERLIA